MSFEPYDPSKHVITDMVDSGKHPTDLEENEAEIESPQGVDQAPLIDFPPEMHTERIIDEIDRAEEERVRRRRLLVIISLVSFIILLLIIILAPRRTKRVGSGFTAENIVILQPDREDMIRMPFRTRGFVGSDWVTNDEILKLELFDNTNVVISTVYVHVPFTDQVEPGVSQFSVDFQKYRRLPFTEDGFIQVTKPRVNSVKEVSAYQVPIIFNPHQIGEIRSYLEGRSNTSNQSEGSNFWSLFKFSGSTNDSSGTGNNENNSQFNYISSIYDGDGSELGLPPNNDFNSGNNSGNQNSSSINSSSTNSSTNTSNTSNTTTTSTTTTSTTITPGINTSTNLSPGTTLSGGNTNSGSSNNSFSGNREPATKSISLVLNLWFPHVYKDEDGDPICTFDYPARHYISRTEQPVTRALQELITGPTSVELGTGHVNTIKNNLTITALSIDQGVARVRFDRDYYEPTSYPCDRSDARKQIEKTLEEFYNIDTVIIN